jgi:uncharacterized membrane protein YwzB
MNGSLQGVARRAGALYLLFSLVAIVGEFVIPSAMVPGDPAATARNITSAETLYRVDLLIAFVTLLLFACLVVSLHRLFQDVDRSQSMLMVVLVSIGIAVSLANMLHKFTPLVLLTDADYLSVFPRPQVEAMALNALRQFGQGAAVSTTFWGLWLFPFGILAIRSGFIPRVFGVLLLVAGIAYLTSGVTSLVLPEYRPAVSRAMMPLYFGEVPVIFWLLFKGVRMPRVEPASRGEASGSGAPARSSGNWDLTRPPAPSAPAAEK